MSDDSHCVGYDSQQGWRRANLARARDRAITVDHARRCSVERLAIFVCLCPGEDKRDGPAIDATTPYRGRQRLDEIVTSAATWTYERKHVNAAVRGNRVF
jgi:hypothetical protein